MTDEQPRAGDSGVAKPAPPSPLTVVGWLWSNPQCKTQYTPAHANTWARMIHRNLTIPHRFVLMTDQPLANYDRLIEPMELWQDWRELKNETWGITKPQCYVRLKAFSAEAGELFGARFVSIDLDCVVLQNLDSLFDRSEDFLIYRRELTMVPLDKINPYQCSMWMMNAGARRRVWDDFNGIESAHKARAYMGTDQAWIHHVLGPDEKGWTVVDGVYAWPLLRDDARYRHKPPMDAKIIFFYGDKKPWHIASFDRPHCQNCGMTAQINPPWELNMTRRNATDEHQWIPRNYR